LGMIATIRRRSSLPKSALLASHIETAE